MWFSDIECAYHMHDTGFELNTHTHTNIYTHTHSFGSIFLILKSGYLLICVCVIKYGANEDSWYIQDAIIFQLCKLHVFSLIL